MKKNIRINGELVYSSNQSNKEKIKKLKTTMIDCIKHGELEVADCPVTHRFTDGCYLREIFMPEGSVVVGKVHKTTHFNIIISGSVTVFTKDGIKEYSGPCVFESDAGTQKVVRCDSDCVWQTIHVTNLTDLKLLEDLLVEEDQDVVFLNEMLDRISRSNLCHG